MTIELRDLRFFAQHGWHPEEALTGNEFDVSITASFFTEDAVITLLEQTINYAEVYRIAQETFHQPEKLLETVAMKMAQQIKKQFPQLHRIQIAIKKLAAPITGFTGTVGITFTKEY